MRGENMLGLGDGNCLKPVKEWGSMPCYHKEHPAPFTGVAGNVPCIRSQYVKLSYTYMV